MLAPCVALDNDDNASGCRRQKADEVGVGAADVEEKFLARAIPTLRSDT